MISYWNHYLFGSSASRHTDVYNQQMEGDTAKGLGASTLAIGKYCLQCIKSCELYGGLQTASVSAEGG